MTDRGPVVVRRPEEAGDAHHHDYTGTEAFDLLAAEGFPLDAVTAALDGLIARGPVLQQGDKGWILTAAEVEALRVGLRGEPERAPRGATTMGSAPSPAPPRLSGS